MRAVGIALLLACASTAHADPTAAQQASAVSAAGAKFYAAGDYARAAARFDDAYQLDPQPQYLFNAAQAYRLANSCELAAQRYATFLDVVHDVKNGDAVRRYLDDERACAAKQHAAAAPPEPVAPSPTAPITPPVQVAPPAPPPRPAESDALRGQHRAERVAGLALGSVGAALVAFGAFETVDLFYVKAKQRDCTAPNTCSVSQFDGYDRDGRRANTWAPLGLGAGGAAVVGGVILYLIGKDPERAQLAPTTGGAVMSTTFRF